MGRSPAAIGGQRWTIWHVALLAPWIVVASALARPLNDNSFLWHVRAGDAQVAVGSVLTNDPFSFTSAGEPWRTQSWLADLLYSVLDRVSGLAAGDAVVVVAGVLLFVLLGLIMFRAGASVLTAVVVLGASALVLAGFLNPRPAIFGFVLLAATVVCHEDRRLRWCLPLLMWVWAAVHGSFVVGLGYVVLRSMGERRLRRDGPVVPGMVVAILATAHGWATAQIFADFFRRREGLEYLSEWRAPGLLEPAYLPLSVAAVLLVVMAVRRRVTAADVLVAVPFVIAGLSSARSAPLAWIGLVPIVARLELPVASRTTVGRVPAMVLAAGIVFAPLLLIRSERPDPAVLPAAAAQVLVSDRVFHDDAAGGWLIYDQWPHRRVYIDDRAELHGSRLGLLVRISNGSTDWRLEFERWGIEEAMLRTATPLIAALVDAGWSIVHEDEHFTVIRKVDA